MSSSLTDFPILLYISSSAGIEAADVTAVFSELGTNSKKIKVEDSLGDQLYVEIEKWNYTGTPATSEAWLWVKVPAINSGEDTHLTLYYDSTRNDNTAYVGDIGSIPGKNAWSSDHMAVYHLAQNTGGTTYDSTSNVNHSVTITSDPVFSETSGKLGGAFIYPIIKMLLDGYPGVRHKAGCKGGIEKI